MAPDEYYEGVKIVFITLIIVFDIYFLVKIPQDFLSELFQEVGLVFIFYNNNKTRKMVGEIETVYIIVNDLINPRRHKRRGGGQSDTPSIFLALNLCSLTDYQKLWHNCSLLVKTSFDPN